MWKFNIAIIPQAFIAKSLIRFGCEWSTLFLNRRCLVLVDILALHCSRGFSCDFRRNYSPRVTQAFYCFLLWKQDAFSWGDVTVWSRLQNVHSIYLEQIQNNAVHASFLGRSPVFLIFISSLVRCLFLHTSCFGSLVSVSAAVNSR